MARLTLGASLIVKDEERMLPACLESLRGVVDEICVYDTGSTDATVEIARSFGARVQEGFWDGDFARARQAALAMNRTPWVLAVDADERVVADRRALTAVLRAHAWADVLSVRIRNLRADGVTASHDHAAPRLLRRAATRWRSPVHEHPVRVDGRPVTVVECPSEALRLDHLGYADVSGLQAKARRNEAIAQKAIDQVVASGRDVAVAEVADLVLHLGRSRQATGDRQGAVEAFELLRERAPGTPQALEATNMMTDLLLETAMFEPALVLADDLEAQGGQRPYCDWLRARALVGLDRLPEALTLLRGIDEVVDTMGRVRRLADVLELRAHVAIRLRQGDEAVAALVQAMVVEGSVAGRGPLLLRLWSRRAPHVLAALLTSFGDPVHHAAVVTELTGCPDPGPTVAALVAEHLGLPAPRPADVEPVAR